jgi:hypothetical protein
VKERPVLFGSAMVRALLAGRKTMTRRLVKWPDWADDDATRELLVPHPHSCWLTTVGEGGADAWLPPYAEVGDRLWVRETWRPSASRTQVAWNVTYAADGQTMVSDIGRVPETWRMPKAAATGNVSPLFLPRWASRLTLEVTAVRVERLQAITEEDAVAEGVESVTLPEEWVATRESSDGSLDLLSFERQPSPALLRELRLSGVRHNKASTVLTAREAFERLWRAINGAESWAANPWVWVVAFRKL